MPSLTEADLDILFRQARSHNGWQDKDVPDALLQQVWDLAKWGPTSMNCLPLRIVFVKSGEAKEKLKGCLMQGNVEKTMTAPVTAIFAYDLDFPAKMDKLWHSGGKAFEGKPDLIQTTAFRNSSLQAAYFMLAARSLGLDCGPMSGFDNGKVDAAFFAGTNIKSNFICAIGYGNPEKLYPRSVRLEFSEIGKIA